MYAEFACVRKESEREKKSGGERETERERERERERGREREISLPITPCSVLARNFLTLSRVCRSLALGPACFLM